MSAVVMGASFGWTVRNVQSRGQTGPSLSLSLALAIRAPRLLMVQDLPKRCPQCFSELVPLDTFVGAESLEVCRGWAKGAPSTTRCRTSWCTSLDTTFRALARGCPSSAAELSTLRQSGGCLALARGGRRGQWKAAIRRRPAGWGHAATINMVG